MKLDRIIIADNISSATNTNHKNQSKHNTVNVIAQYLNLQLKTLNASNSKLLLCDLVIFSSKPFNCKYILFASFLIQETAKGSFGLRVKLPPDHLSTTHIGSFTQSW